MATAERALPQQTQANLQAAILAVAQIHGLGEVPESVVGYLMDQMRDSLTDQQRLDPASIYSPEVLGQVAARVEEAYGFDRPSNLHGAEFGRGKELAVPDDANSFFAQDAFGLTRQQRQFGGISNEEHTLRSGTALPMGAFRTSYADIDPRLWNPVSGAGGLTAANFASTDFFKAGLDLGTTQSLLGQGYSQTQVIVAAQDTKALGFSPKDQKMVTNFAVMNDYDPEGRPERNEAFQRHRGVKDDPVIKPLREAVLSAEEGTPEHREALAEYRAVIRERRNRNGVTAATDRLCAPTAGSTPEQTEAACSAAQETVDTLEGVTDATAELQIKLGDEAAADASLDALKEATPGAPAEGADQIGDGHDPTLNPGGDAAAPNTAEASARGVFGKPKSSAVEPPPAEAAPPDAAPAQSDAQAPPAEEPKPPEEQLPLPKKGPGPAP